LDPADAFDGPRDREVRTFEQELPGEQRAVPLTLREGALGHAAESRGAGAGTPEEQPRYTAPMADPYLPPAIESPLVVVSNRGPVTFERNEAGGFEAQRGAGGLVTTLAGVFYRDEATWVAAAMTEADLEVPRRQALDHATDLRLRFVSIDPKIYDGYYNGISNGILWFTHHFLWDIARSPTFDESTDDAWHAYEEANRAFAEVLDRSPQDAVFLVQDYQLSLVPMYLRELRPDARIIHFSHTPFAGQTYLRMLPIGMRESLLRGLAGADVLGFQSRTWAENFLLSARSLPGAKADLRRWRLSLDGRTSLIRTFPVSVGAEGLRSIAAQPETKAIRREIRSSLGEQRLLLRVDRLEPSKNILRGFLAYELFLRRNPGWQGRVRFLTGSTQSSGATDGYPSWSGSNTTWTTRWPRTACTTRCSSTRYTTA